MHKRTIACLITVAMGFTVGWSQPAQTPQNLSVTQPGGSLAQSQLDLHWEPVAGALGYEVLRKVNGRWWLNEEDPNCTPMTNATEPVTTGGNTFGFYEPAGGTAPDIAGKNLANPIAQILSTALMLRYSFQLNDAAAGIENAVSQAIAAGNRTGDIFSPNEANARKVGTREMGDAIAAAV